ncbi:MAG TPA: 4'-phosphopantetheinyl transferase superfamily protein, partial [Longimicrobiales bacterium]
LQAGACEVVPEDDDWLSPAERAVLAGLGIEKRRRDWRLGRWLAKRAVLGWLESRGRRAPLTGVEILAAPDGAPEVSLPEVVGLVGSRELPAPRLSLSHAAGPLAGLADGLRSDGGRTGAGGGAMGFAALVEGTASLGCDVERVESRSRRFLADYLVTGERDFVEGAITEEGRALATNLVWSAKESALKAMRCGLREDTRSVVVEVPGPEVSAHLPRTATVWRRLRLRIRSGDALHGWWRASGGFVWTVVCQAPLSSPAPWAPPV